jgi:hypothetical protein
LAAVEDEQDSFDVPEPPVMLVGLREQVRLVEFVVEARLTVPVKPLRGAMVIVELPSTPKLTVELVGLAVIVKSGDPGAMTATVTVLDCVADPLVPVRVTM